MCLEGTLPSGLRLHPVDKTPQDSWWKFVFQSLRAGAALRSGEVIENSFSLASGKLINTIFGTESCTLRE